MRILVIGGAGFIGSHTVDALLAKSHEVRILDNLQKPVHLKGKPDYLPDTAEFVLGDVRDKDQLRAALDGIEAVYHFAAYQDYLPDFSTYFDVNCTSTALLYELIVENELPVKKVIVASSQAVLGEGLYECPVHGVVSPNIRLEEQLQKAVWEHACEKCAAPLQCKPTPEAFVNPQNQYALSKHTQESIAIHLGQRYGIPSVAMRYSIVQGPRQSFYNAYSGAMRIFALHLYFQKPPLIYEDGNQLRDYTNIHDVVDANLLVMESAHADYEVFNVGCGISHTVLEFYRTLESETGENVEPRMDNCYRFGDTRHITSANDKLVALGWAPRGTINDSVREYWDYLNQQTDIADILEHAELSMKRMNVVRQTTSVRSS